MNYAACVCVWRRPMPGRRARECVAMRRAAVGERGRWGVGRL